MATGPEHYRLSEHAIENAKYEEGDSARERFFLDVALIHATLANAAATAMRTLPPDGAEMEAWRNAVAPAKDGAL